MGFHKRHINIEITKNALKNKTLDKLYKAESLTFESDGSSKAYELYKEGKCEDEILEILDKKKVSLFRKILDFLTLIEEKRLEGMEKSGWGKF